MVVCSCVGPAAGAGHCKITYEPVRLFHFFSESGRMKNLGENCALIINQLQFPPALLKVDFQRPQVDVGRPDGGSTGSPTVRSLSLSKGWTEHRHSGPALESKNF